MVISCLIYSNFKICISAQLEGANKDKNDYGKIINILLFNYFSLIFVSNIYHFTSWQVTPTKKYHNEYDDDSSDASMESESGSINVSDVKCTLLPKTENENEAQHQIISKIANTKKIFTKLCNKKRLHWLVLIVWHIIMEGINMTMERGLNLKDPNHPKFNDYFHDCKHIVRQSIAYRRSYATKQMKKKLKSKFKKPLLWIKEIKLKNLQFCDY